MSCFSIELKIINDILVFIGPFHSCQWRGFSEQLTGMYRMSSLVGYSMLPNGSQWGTELPMAHSEELSSAFDHKDRMIIAGCDLHSVSVKRILTKNHDYNGRPHVIGKRARITTRQPAISKGIQRNQGTSGSLCNYSQFLHQFKYINDCYVWKSKPTFKEVYSPLSHHIIPHYGNQTFASYVFQNGNHVFQEYHALIVYIILAYSASLEVPYLP